jgi:hypothetical protein
MKTIRKITGSAMFAVLAIVTVQSASPADIRNWPKWMQPKSAEKAVSTPASPGKVMECSKCATVTVVTRRDLIAGKSGHGFTYVPQAVHQCDGCRDNLARKSGTKEMELAHNCSAVGQKALCCDTNRSSGRGA